MYAKLHESASLHSAWLKGYGSIGPCVISGLSHFLGTFSLAGHFGPGSFWPNLEGCFCLILNQPLAEG